MWHERLSSAVLAGLAALASGPQARCQEAPTGPVPGPGAVLDRLADSPIPWRPWGPEALDRARRERRPILLWSAYVGCGWCERMRAESFTDPELAEFVAAHFVPVAVDREERPTVDQMYLGAHAVVFGESGWPITALLDPETLQPFYIGTYFPPADDAERELPSFERLLRTAADQWEDEREPLLQFARRLAAGLPEIMAPEVTADGIPRGLVERGLEVVLAEYDSRHGGFGAGSKFPRPERLELLADAGPPADAEGGPARAALLHTLHALTRGALHDHLEGGFRRAALDRAWDVPEFGKPLPLQTRLAAVLARAGVEHERPELTEAARRACDWVLATLAGEDGRMYAGVDGAYQGRGGRAATWTRTEVEAAVGEELAGLVARRFGLTGAPLWRDASDPEAEPRHVLRRPAPLPGGVLPEADAVDPAALARALVALRAARASRPAPPLDRRVIAGWSGLAAAGLAEVGALLDEPAYVEAAAAALDFVEEELRDGDGRLRRTWRDGRLGAPAVAQDLVGLLRGHLALHAATGEERWLDRARALHAEGQARFGADDGGWFDAARADLPRLPVVPRSVADGELPGVNGELLVAQVELARRTEDPELLAAAAATALSLGARVAQDPGAAARALQGLARLERHFPDRVPRGDGPVVRARDALVTYELRRDPAPPTPREGGTHLLLTLTTAEGHHIAAADPVVDGPRGLGLELEGPAANEAVLLVQPVEPDYGRLAVEGAPLATHGDETLFHLFVSPPAALAELKLTLTLEVWSEQGPTPLRTLALDLSRFAP